MMLGDAVRLTPPAPLLRLIVSNGNVGVGSLGLVTVVSVFTGAVAAVRRLSVSSVVPLKLYQLGDPPQN